MRELELLAPAANKEVAFEAILHGADAVYMGASSHGARKNAANSIEDIAEVVRFAHQFRVRVYITINTLVYESEISSVESLIRDLYVIGVDAIIVQDMGVLRMNIPPIALHASTQCDTRTVEKGEFLEKVGFSQIVLARELTIEEIKDICDHVTVPVECFVHGALCVSYSGRCRASFVETGRSANRGECSQMCRMKYDLIDANGQTIVKNKYLLSLKDFNLSANIAELIEAGVSSFKIEGRLKDVSYVKNVVSYYRIAIDKVITANPEKYRRSSYGKSRIEFVPVLDKSFNRGFTSYFFKNRENGDMASLDTPKSKGEKITNLSQLNNGDGISFINSNGEFEGVRVNKVENGKLIGATPFVIPRGAEIRRTFDNDWQKKLAKPTAKRSIALDLTITENYLCGIDERGVQVVVPLDSDKMEAETRMYPEKVLGKLGNTIYYLRNFENHLYPNTYIPASQLNQLKRTLLDALDNANNETYKFDYRRREDFSLPYFERELDEEGNVSNSLAKKFYEDHGAQIREMAIEATGDDSAGKIVMRTRYCVRRELGICKKYKKSGNIKQNFREPFMIVSGVNMFQVEFDCAKCEMRIINTDKGSRVHNETRSPIMEKPKCNARPSRRTRNFR